MVEEILFYQYDYFFFIAKQQESANENKAATRKQLLLLALAWDAIDVAKEHIIKEDLSDLDVNFKEMKIIIQYSCFFLYRKKLNKNYSLKL